MYVCWHTLKTSCHTFLICFCKYIPIQLSPPSPCTLPKQSSPTGFCQRKVSCYDLPAIVSCRLKTSLLFFLGGFSFLLLFLPPCHSLYFRSLALPQSRKQLSEWIHILAYFIWLYFCLFFFLISISIILQFGYILRISFGYIWSSWKKKPRDLLFLYLFYDTKVHYQGPNRETNIPRPHDTSTFFSFR